MEHIDSATIEELAQKLTQEKQRLEKELGSFAHKNKDVADDWETNYEDIGDGVDENAFEVEEFSNKRAVEHELEVRLKKVNAALARIADGSYGLCETDSKPIAVERLRANPATAHCAEHAQ